jgi:hypothetical protein
VTGAWPRSGSGGRWSAAASAAASAPASAAAPSDRHRRLKELFAALSETPHEERPAWLRALAAAEPQLAAELVEELRQLVELDEAAAGEVFEAMAVRLPRTSP